MTALRTYRLERTLRVERPRDEVFAFFGDAANLEAITPAFLRFRILTPTPVEMRPGARIDYALSLFGVPLRWRTRITAWEPGVRFVDEQESGPYALWRHTHEFESAGEATVVRDVVEYAVPLGPLGRIAHDLMVRRALDRIFDHRSDAIRRLLGGAGAHAEESRPESGP
jgi:ligand-binding SRPBCC domain-containing protein